ncbi:HNH endonuclease (plasmid) [Trichormus variabilis ATCC 29413]|uniref:HNH endonuclease n=3 Tax=Nostocaceae TaxID=1162 RepID=A0A0M4T7C8_9NOSO|nr:MULTISPECIES: RNA-guided endonuclease IscB [Nostocaceae]ABA25210.1 HNH endonuclease [Trichormus variabilis ATCC 29413]ALF55279.1 HNH endonuclease [Nostoc piscinale CENA21]MBC1218179.1 RRXRR domain-containing protein [Trichormus variabilis ARAD]MBC1259494.1 RRXRR domain-containing protein [Trichormus variabilis V5]MBC1270961.1 RRXRR domain-containing protein [Trichormus variabilis FSR]
MSKVFVLDTEKRPLDPIHSAQARQLLRNKKAAVFRRFPFTIILKESRADASVSDLRIKLDPGAKITGIALVNDSTGEVVFAADLKHRGFAIRDALISRRQLRRTRRNRKTRYRKPRFLNRTRSEGWLAPSLMSRVHNVETWVNRLRKFAPITAISTELVKFDMQLMRNPEIEGKEYQQGTLAGYETREFLLEKWNRQCAYCGIKDIPLQIEHIHSRSKGGSNSITNLTLSCEKCNVKKGTKDIKDFLKKDPTRLQKILAQAKKPLADAAAVNATRYKLLEVLKSTDLPVECGSGGLTKFNRTNQQLQKTHWLDAACVGQSTPILIIKGIKPLLITANGHGTRQMCRTDKFGFPNRYVPKLKFIKGFQTGDIVKAVVTNGKKIGEYIGRVAVRSTGSFNISAQRGLIQGINYKFCKSIHKKDGYSYSS